MRLIHRNLLLIKLVDLILKAKGHIYPFEIKTSMTPNKSFSRHLLSFVSVEKYAKDPRIIYAGKGYPVFSKVEYVNFKMAGKFFKV